MRILEIIDLVIQEQQMLSPSGKTILDPENPYYPLNEVLNLNGAFFDAMIAEMNARIEALNIPSEFVRVRHQAAVSGNKIVYTGPTGYSITICRAPFKSKWTTLFYAKVIELLKQAKP